MIDLKRKIWIAFGVRGSGKSTLSNHIARANGPKTLYYDTVHEVPDAVNYHTYRPRVKYGVGAVEELTEVIKLILGGKSGYTQMVIDEASRFCPSKPAPLPQAVAEINDLCRHMKGPDGFSVGFIARRPVTLNQDLTELADYLFIYRLVGRNDVAFLNDTADGLGDAVKALPLHPPGYFYLVRPDRSYSLMRPVPIDAAWDRREARHKKT